MIRKFEDNDIDDIMQIWKSANIKAHNFISNTNKINKCKEYRHNIVDHTLFYFSN